MRKLGVWALVSAFVFITTWILAAHVGPRTTQASHSLRIAHPSIAAAPFEMGG